MDTQNAIPIQNALKDDAKEKRRLSTASYRQRQKEAFALQDAVTALETTSTKTSDKVTCLEKNISLITNNQDVLYRYIGHIEKQNQHFLVVISQLMNQVCQLQRQVITLDSGVLCTNTVDCRCLLCSSGVTHEDVTQEVPPKDSLLPGVTPDATHVHHYAEPVTQDAITYQDHCYTDQVNSPEDLIQNRLDHLVYL